MRPKFVMPAGVAVAFPLPPGFSGQGFDAHMQPVQGVGFNAANQLVDASGALVLDTSGRPVSNPVTNVSDTTTIGQQHPAAPTIGTPPPTVSTFPWGLVLTVGLVGGFVYFRR